MPPSPLISVLMPVRDARQYLAQAVQSIQAQSYTNWELVIVDDSSNDGSAELAGELARADGRLRVLSVPSGGAAPAVNAGAAVAQGELIARMDADDIASPDRFAIQLDWMRRSEVGVCGSLAKRFGGAGGLLWFPELDEAIAREMLFRHGLLQPTVLAQASVFRQMGYRPGARFEGNDLWIRARRSFKLGNVPTVLLQHRCHGAQTHVTRCAGLQASLRASRQELLVELYPDAGPADAELISRLAEHAPARSVEELRRAGAWLIRLSDCPETQLRRRMLARWRRVCRASAGLGPRVYRAYVELVPGFRTGEPRHDPRLRAACLVRRPAPGARRTAGKQSAIRDRLAV